MKTASAVAAIIPATTTVPRIWRPLAPEPEAIASGMQPRMNANDVIRIGRSRIRRPPAPHRRCHVPCAFRPHEFDNQNRVLGRKADQHHQSDLRVDIEIEMAEVQSGEGAENRNRNGKQHRERQRPAFVERRQIRKRRAATREDRSRPPPRPCSPDRRDPPNRNPFPEGAFRARTSSTPP